MSHTLTLSKNGIISTKKWVYDEEKEVGSYVITELPVDCILTELNTYIDSEGGIEEGFTLRDYFRTIVTYDKLQLLDGFMDEYIEEYLNCPLEGCISEDMTHLRLVKNICVELDEDDNVTSVEDYFVFDGVNSSPDEPFWGIEFTPLNKLLDIPIKIEKTTVYINKFGKKYKSLDSKTYVGPDGNGMKLFDFITEIIWELSFMGTPERRNAKAHDLDIAVEEIKNGTAELFPWDDTIFGGKDE